MWGKKGKEKADEIWTRNATAVKYRRIQCFENRTGLAGSTVNRTRHRSGQPSWTASLNNHWKNRENQLEPVNRYRFLKAVRFHFFFLSKIMNQRLRKKWTCRKGRSNDTDGYNRIRKETYESLLYDVLQERGTHEREKRKTTKQWTWKRVLVWYGRKWESQISMLLDG